jgi:hypothetical protein
LAGRLIPGLISSDDDGFETEVTIIICFITKFDRNRLDRSPRHLVGAASPVENLAIGAFYQVWTGAAVVLC